MFRRLSVVLVSVLAAATLTAPVSAQRLATNLSCGDTITMDTTLHADLINCPNNGIVIGADNMTLDLNGHRVDGDNSFFGGCAQVSSAMSEYSTMDTMASP